MASLWQSRIAPARSPRTCASHKTRRQIIGGQARITQHLEDSRGSSITPSSLARMRPLLRSTQSTLSRSAMVPRKLSYNNPSISPYNRISLVSQHLNPETTPATSSQNQLRTVTTMSSQPEHPTLLIPGPIEFDDAVLQSMSHYRCVSLGPRSLPLYSQKASEADSCRV